MNESRPVIALSGGVGGAKLALGLYRILAPDHLCVVCNTGDDFEHMGLHVSPDIDTVMYTLAGIENPHTGWGRDGETWDFMDAVAELDGDTWFRLGDRDLAIHVQRTQRLGGGETLTEITARFCRRLGVRSHLWPMSDQPVRTRVRTADGTLPFQVYFVQRACEPQVTGFCFEGAGQAAPNPRLIEFLERRPPGAVVICPSNPYISIDPILAVPGLAGALTECGAPVIAVSPVVAGTALKGPTAKMMRELGVPVTTVAIAQHYGDLLDGLVVDESDVVETGAIDLPCHVTRTVMNSIEDKQSLAREVMAFGDRLSRDARR